MEEQVCRNCAFYLQHFTMDKGRIFRVYCGHCKKRHHKRRLPDATICELFQPGSLPEDSFVSKEYLSKELLQYVLSMELLPEIEQQG